MKKRPLLLIAFSCLLILLLATLAFFTRQPLPDRLLAGLEDRLGGTVTVGELDWRLLPIPTINIKQLRAETAAFHLLLPQAQLMLNPKSFLSGKMSLARATLIGPELAIKAHPPGPAPPAAEPDDSPEGGGIGAKVRGMLLADHIIIKGGMVTLPECRLDQHLMLPAHTLAGINGTIAAQSNSLKFELRAESLFATSIEAKGKIDLRQGKYQLDLTGFAVDSGRLFSSAPSEAGLEQAPPLDLPTLTAPILAAHLEGLGPDHFQLGLSSRRSPLLISWREQTLQVANLEGVTLDRQGEDFRLDIKDLALAAPRLQLHGHVARQLVVGATTPSWDIDLDGADLDLAAVRTAILANFGDHPVARQVCTIVQGGTARTARFAFQGGSADFAHLKNMKIWAEAQDVAINLPALPLTIDAASGPIAIINSQLTGQGLTATIDQSQGTSGDLLLDLGKDEHSFHLELDLDTDLQNLQDVLGQIIPARKFQEELSQFTEVKGRAQGHLRLGDDLHQLNTEVAVRQVEARGLYKRLPWPFTISQGSLKVTVFPFKEGLNVPPSQVAWEDIGGSLGPQQISRSTGVVAWGGEAYLTINALDADLDLKNLLEEEKLRDLTKTWFDELSGQALLRASTFSGPLQRPREWQFHSTVQGRDLLVSRPGWPTLASPKIDAEISQQGLDFTGGCILLEQELLLTGHYGHQLFAEWHGDLEVNGEIGQRLGEWLAEGERWPAVAFLRLPFRVDKFILSNQGPGVFQAQGTILPVAEKLPGAIRLQVASRRQKGHSIDSLIFENGAQQGKLSSEVWPEEGGRSLLNWEGELDTVTIDALLGPHFLQSGWIQGSGSRRTELNSTTYNGVLEARGLHFLAESLTPELTIDRLRLRGKDHTVTVEQAALAVAGDPATIVGSIKAEQDLHRLDLQVKAPHLAWASGYKFFEDYRRKQTATGQGKSISDSLRGTIGFDFKAFDYTYKTKAPAGDKGTEGEGGGEGSHTLTAAPLSGRVEFTAAEIALQIDHAKVCGISGQGNWHFGKETGDDAISFSSGQDPLSFAQALPCLGIKQSLIQGPFALHGQFSGRPRAWRQGSITLLSSEGLIKRMTLLSKIFTAVNFTDYLTWNDLPDLQGEGLFYNDLTLKAHVDNNQLVLDRTFIRGKGVNVSGRGTINLTDLNSDLTFFIAPFKGLDWLVSNIPLIGKALAGPKESILTFPVSVTGNIKAPEVTSLAPTAVGSAVFELFRDTMTLPFRIFLPAEDSP